MGTHIGRTPTEIKEIADDITRMNQGAHFTTYVKNGIRRYSWTYISSGTFRFNISILKLL